MYSDNPPHLAFSIRRSGTHCCGHLQTEGWLGDGLRFERKCSTLLIAVRYPIVEHNLRLAVDRSKRDSHSLVWLHMRHIPKVCEYHALMRNFQRDFRALRKGMLRSHEA